MSIGRGLALSIVAAGVGAGLWIGLYLLTGLNFRLVAIAIGGLAGFGMGLGNYGRGGVGAGLAAALVTFVGVLGAQATVCHLAIREELAEGIIFTEEEAKSAFAGQVYEEFEAEGVEMGEWEDEADYPADVMATADHRWKEMDAAARAEYTASLAAEWGETAEAAAPILTGLSFLVNFGLFGWVFLCLAMSSAFKIGSAVAKEEVAEGAVTVDATEPSEGGGSFFARLGPPAAEQPPVEQNRAA